MKTVFEIRQVSRPSRKNDILHKREKLLAAPMRNPSLSTYQKTIPHIAISPNTTTYDDTGMKEESKGSQGPDDTNRTLRGLILAGKAPYHFARKVVCYGRN